MCLTLINNFSHLGATTNNRSHKSIFPTSFSFFPISSLDFLLFRDYERERNFWETEKLVCCEIFKLWDFLFFSKFFFSIAASDIHRWIFNFTTWRRLSSVITSTLWVFCPDRSFSRQLLTFSTLSRGPINLDVLRPSIRLYAMSNKFYWH